MYIHTCIYIHMYIWMNILIHIYIHTYSLSMYAYRYICVSIHSVCKIIQQVDAGAFFPVSQGIRMYIYVCIYKNLYIVHIWIHVHEYISIFTRVVFQSVGLVEAGMPIPVSRGVCMNMGTYIYTYIHIYIYIRIYVYLCVYIMCVHVYIQVCMYKYTYMFRRIRHYTSAPQPNIKYV